MGRKTDTYGNGMRQISRLVSTACGMRTTIENCLLEAQNTDGREDRAQSLEAALMQCETMIEHLKEAIA